MIVGDGCANCRRLTERVEELEETLRQALTEAVVFSPPRAWKLTLSETVILRTMVSRRLVTRDSIMAALEAARPHWDAQPKIVDVFLCKMRRKLAPFGVQVETVNGQGWAISDAQRAAIMSACSEDGPEQIAPARSDGGGSRRRGGLTEAILAILPERGATGLTSHGVLRMVQASMPEVTMEAVSAMMSHLARKGTVARTESQTTSHFGRPSQWLYTLPEAAP